MTTVSAGTKPASQPVAPASKRPVGERSRNVPTVRLGLLWTLVRTDFKSRYHGTLGGFVWALLKPLSMFVVLMSVFSLLFASTPTYKLDLVVGLFLWDFFAEGTKSGLTSLHARGYLLTKARIPSWILVVTSISNALITLAVFAVIIVIFLAAAGRPPGLRELAAFGLYCGASTAIVVGFSLASSVLFLRYRDLNQVWEVALQAGFFLAPVMYPLAVLPESVRHYLFLWPPTTIIELSRAVLVAGTSPATMDHAALAAAVAVCLAGGIAVYRWLAPRSAELL